MHCGSQMELMILIMYKQNERKIYPYQYNESNFFVFLPSSLETSVKLTLERNEQI